VRVAGDQPDDVNTPPPSTLDPMSHKVSPAVKETVLIVAVTLVNRAPTSSTSLSPALATTEDKVADTGDTAPVDNSAAATLLARSVPRTDPSEAIT
jgi:hypothetical protein